MGRQTNHASTRATKALVAAHVRFRTLAYDPDDIPVDRPSADGSSVDGSLGARVASLLGLDPSTVFKTLIALADGATVVAVVPVGGHLDLRALARADGSKRATMADATRAERETGYVVGGISPMGQRRTHRTYVDDSARGLDAIALNGGRRGLMIVMDPADLIRVLDASFAPIASP